jgi:hypothetical protein
VSKEPTEFDRKLNIMGFEFEVFEQQLDNNSGESRAHTRTITIDSDAPRDVKVETLYHEVAHMVLRLAGFDNLMEEKVEEALAQYLGLALTHFLSNNDQLPVLDPEVEIQRKDA